MHYLVTSSNNPREALSAESVPAMAAFVIASIWYKFGSFALECVAFVATWYVLSLIVTKLRR